MKADDSSLLSSESSLDSSPDSFLRRRFFFLEDSELLELRELSSDLLDEPLLPEDELLEPEEDDNDPDSLLRDDERWLLSSELSRERDEDPELELPEPLSDREAEDSELRSERELDEPDSDRDEDEREPDSDRELSEPDSDFDDDEPDPDSDRDDDEPDPDSDRDDDEPDPDSDRDEDEPDPEPEPDSDLEDDPDREDSDPLEPEPDSERDEDEPEPDSDREDDDPDRDDSDPLDEDPLRLLLDPLKLLDRLSNKELSLLRKLDDSEDADDDSDFELEMLRDTCDSKLDSELSELSKDALACDRAERDSSEADSADRCCERSCFSFFISDEISLSSLSTCFLRLSNLALSSDISEDSDFASAFSMSCRTFEISSTLFLMPSTRREIIFLSSATDSDASDRDLLASAADSLARAKSLWADANLELLLESSLAIEDDIPDVKLPDEEEEDDCLFSCFSSASRRLAKSCTLLSFPLGLCFSTCSSTVVTRLASSRSFSFCFASCCSKSRARAERFAKSLAKAAEEDCIALDSDDELPLELLELLPLDELDEEAERSEDSLERDGNPELLSDEDSPRLLDSERALDSSKELLRLLDPRRELLSDDDSARLLDSDRELDSSEELLELLPLDDLLRLLDSRPDSLDSRPDSLDSNPFSPREDASDCRLLDSEREERSLLSLPLSFSLASSQTGSWGTSFLDASELFQAGGNSSDTMAA